MGLRVTDSNSKVLATHSTVSGKKKKRTLAQKCAASVIVWVSIWIGIWEMGSEREDKSLQTDREVLTRFNFDFWDMGNKTFLRFIDRTKGFARDGNK